MTFLLQTVCLVLAIWSFLGKTTGEIDSGDCNVEEWGTLENGGVLTQSQYAQVGEQVDLYCDSGYYVAGCNRLTCKEDGTFSPSSSQVVCFNIDECRDIIDTSDTDGLYSLYSDYFEACDSYTDMNSLPVHNCHENAVCVDTTGSFRCECPEDYVGDGAITCEYDPPDCDMLPPPENGFITHNTSKKTEFDCNGGYKMYGSRSRNCRRESGWDGISGWAWDGVPPKCEKTGCGDPGRPINGFKIGSNYEPGNRVTFGCEAGYTLEGSDSRVCTKDKFWTGWQPICRPPKQLGDIAEDIRRDFIDKLELFSDSSQGTSAQGRLARGSSVGLDLVFAFDKSSSVGRINFQKGLNFTKALIEEFGVDYENFGGTRVAVVSFASVAKIEFDYTDGVDTKEKVFDKLDEMENTLGGGTAMKEALEFVAIDLNSQMRNNSKKALFIITDGHANTDDPVGIAKDLRKRDFEIFAIGIGNDVDREQIRTVASSPYTSHVFLINTFDDLAKITDVIAEKRTDYTKCGVAGDWELPPTDIPGVTNANYNAWPWLAHVYHNSYGFYCEGALICEEWVVVAASCLDEKSDNGELKVVSESELYVELGKHSYLANEGTEQNATVKKIHRPDTYDNETLDSDIALLQLDHAIVLVNAIRTICLPTTLDKLNFYPGSQKESDRCFQVGWGRENTWTNDFIRIPNFTPRQVNMPLVGAYTCGDNLDEEIDDDIICSGKWRKGYDECTGQMGTPLVCRRDDDTWAMMGVLIDGSRCNDLYPEYGYSFFTKVYNHVQWINDVTEKCHDAHVRQAIGGL